MTVATPVIRTTETYDLGEFVELEVGTLHPDGGRWFTVRYGATDVLLTEKSAQALRNTLNAVLPPSLKWDDVDALRALAEVEEGRMTEFGDPLGGPHRPASGEWVSPLRGLADRIAAQLPPREPA